jgi:tRNA A64-2'-O-ribosylphosphate transferase
VVAAVVTKAEEQNIRKPSAILKVGGRILVSSTHDLGAIEDDIAWVLITSGSQVQGAATDENSHILRLVTPEGRKGQAHFLRHIIPRSIEFIGQHLTQDVNVCVACEDGRDLSVGIAVVALQQFFDEDGGFIGTKAHINPGTVIFFNFLKLHETNATQTRKQSAND